MKKLNLIVTVLMALVMQVATAQTQLWGVASQGGSHGFGTIFKADGNGSNFQIVHSMDSTNGAYPWGKLCLANNGKLYGTTINGGCGGVCFAFDPITNNYSTFHNFGCDTIHGNFSQSGMILATDGNLYGLCAGGGATNNGVIFKVNPNTNTYSDIFDFSGTNGAAAYSSLIQLSDGNLYGMTGSGGAHNAGVLFKFNPANSTYSLLHSLDSSSGYFPYLGGLIKATNGKLYGMTNLGGAHNMGVIFSYDISTNIYSDIFDFNGPNGAEPRGGLIQATDGKLYGMTYAGGAQGSGILFNFDITTNTLTDLLDFNNTNGSSPRRGVIQASNGKLYGVTTDGGSLNGGVVFSYDIASSNYSILENCDALTVGIGPRCDFIETPLLNGINELSAKNSIMIYPNPANTFITVKLPLSNINSQLVITDMIGNKIHSQELNTIGNSIDVSKWSRGVYFLQVRNERESVVRKIIIQ